MLTYHDRHIHDPDCQLDNDCATSRATIGAIVARSRLPRLDPDDHPASRIARVDEARTAAYWFATGRGFAHDIAWSWATEWAWCTADYVTERRTSLPNLLDGFDEWISRDAFTLDGAS